MTKKIMNSMPCISIIKSPQSRAYLYRASEQTSSIVLYPLKLFSLFVPVAHQRDDEGNTTGEKDNAATETKQVVVGKTLRDEEYGADNE
jgi:hypothetical protein